MCCAADTGAEGRLKPDARVVVGVLALCGALGLAAWMLLWYYHPAVVVCSAKPVIAPTGDGIVPKAPPTSCTTQVPATEEVPQLPGFLITAVTCGALAASAAVLARLRLSIPKTARALLLLVGSALLLLAVWPIVAWYGLIVLSGNDHLLDLFRNDWVAKYALDFLTWNFATAQQPIGTIAGSLAASLALLFVSRLDGRTVGEAMRSIILRILLPLMFAVSIVVLFFDRIEFGVQLAPPPLAMVTNSDVLFGAFVLLALLMFTGGVVSRSSRTLVEDSSAEPQSRQRP